MIKKCPEKYFNNKKIIEINLKDFNKKNNSIFEKSLAFYKNN